MTFCILSVDMLIINSTVHDYGHITYQYIFILPYVDALIDKKRLGEKVDAIILYLLL